MNGNKRLSDIVYEARKSLDLTQKQLSYKSGISLRHISNIEGDKVEPNTIKVVTLQKISNTLNIKLDQLLFFVK